MESQVLNSKYKIISQIGKGGMSFVYTAEHITLKRKFAIKKLADHLTHAPGFKERFQKEGLAQAQLQHDNIVQVVDSFEDEDSFYLVMDYINGESLDNKIKRLGKLPQNDAINYVQDILDALNYAHERKIIHRDIKPSNIIISEQNKAKLLDFGIAIMIGDVRLTSTGMNIGTPLYMSPEQINKPKSVDHRSDVYSVGIVLYEMLTGKIPFDGETDYSIKEQHVNKAVPPPKEINPGISQELNTIIMKALEKNPDNRFRGCGDFLEYLNAALTNDFRKQVKENSKQLSDQTSKTEQKQIRKWPVFLFFMLILIISSIYIIIHTGLLTFGNNESTQKDSIDPQAKHTTDLVAPPVRKLYNSIGMAFIYVPSGSFEMGSPLSEFGRDTSENRHTVKLTKSYYIQAKEITNKQFVIFLNSSSSTDKEKFLDTNQKDKDSRIIQKGEHYFVIKPLYEDHPVIEITWYGLKAMAEWLSKKENFLYMLPTEAQWEYAARATTKSPFFFGTCLDASQSNYNAEYPYMNCSKGVFRQKTLPVGLLKSNKWGLFDMHGNVSEWCNDWYEPLSQNSCIDPVGPSKGQQRVIRGGSYDSKAIKSRSASRDRMRPQFSNRTTGGRLVRMIR